MSLLLRNLLSRFLTLGVGEPDDPPPEGGDPNPPAETIDDDAGSAIDDLLDAGDEDPPPKDDPKERLTAAERRAEQAERELAAERASRQLAPAPAARDPEFEKEEQELARVRESGDQNALDWAQWRINQNRVIRNSERNSQQALAQAQDISDKAEFDRLEVTKPKTYKAYKDRIEDAISKMRANGQPVMKGARMAALSYLIGQDTLNGKLKAKVTKPAAPEGQPQRVERTRLPGTRSDVSGRASQSEREKRRARLENQPI